MMENQTDAIEKVRRVRDQVARRVQERPEVSLVDIGDDSKISGGQRRLAVRVHVRRHGIDLDLPDEIDGVPVRVVVGDYRLE